MSTPDEHFRLLPILAVPLFVGACVESAWTVCPDGRLCEPGLVCDTSSGTCADAECLGKAEGIGCGTRGNICQAGRCARSCGDGVVNGADECDDSDLGPWTCQSDGIDHYLGSVVCRADCTIDSSGCSGSCGDGTEDRGFELCDPTGFDPSRGEDCVSQGFDAGRQGCARDCDGLSNDPCMRFGWVEEDPVADPDPDLGPDPDVDTVRDIWGADRDLFILLGPGGVRSRGQSWRPVGADGASIDGRALYASSSTDIWVINAAGDGFFHWDGTGWIEVASPVSRLNEIWGASASDIFAVGDRGAAVHFDGSRWAAQGTPVPARDLRAIWGVSRDEVYAAGEGGTLLRHDGSGWSARASGTRETLIGVWARSTSDVWTISETTVRRFDGTKWTAMLAIDAVPGGPPAARGWIAGTGSSDIWISAGVPATVRRYDGIRWSTILADDRFDPKPLWVDPSPALAAAPQVAVGFNDGGGDGTVKLWYGAGIGPRLDRFGSWHDVWAFDPDTWIAVGSDVETFERGAALHSNGATFSFDRPLSTVAGFAPDRVYAADTGGTIFGWNGSAWSVARPAGKQQLVSRLWASGSRDLYALAGDPAMEEAPRVLRFDGQIWTELPPLESCGTAGMDGWASSPEDIFVVGSDLFAHFDGSVWSCLDDEAVASFYPSVWGSGPGDVWVEENPSFAQARHLHHWNGVEWTTHVFALDPQTKIVLGGLTGTAPDDVFLSNVAHYDGRVWSPLRPSAMVGYPILALPARLFTLDQEKAIGLDQFVRTRFWNQRDREVGCADGVDDDTDGLTDRDDDDCADALRDAR